MTKSKGRSLRTTAVLRVVACIRFVLLFGRRKVHVPRECATKAQKTSSNATAQSAETKADARIAESFVLHSANAKRDVWASESLIFSTNCLELMLYKKSDVASIGDLMNKIFQRPLLTRITTVAVGEGKAP